MKADKPLIWDVNKKKFKYEGIQTRGFIKFRYHSNE